MSKKEILAGLKSISVPELEDRGCKEVWCINNSAKVGTSGRGQITLTVPNGTGGLMAVNVYNTWAPQNLTEQVNKKMLLDSPSFRSLVGKRAILLIEEKSARAAVDHEEVRLELEKVVKDAGSHGSDPINPMVTTEDVRTLMEEQGANCSPFVLDLLGREANNEVNEQSLLAFLEDREDELTAVDLKYVVNQTNFGKVKTWAAKTLNDLEAE